ncbi:hypothetical protein B0H17DRAFT_1215514 [Mycena rosella]|uniref:Uncharacterized protein n=1 Tax=Mycena rosella TaxID=1033263 RepID=A0AAD7G108_MYCRO|nr:hypothetical protein B0H17DRAFT_1215514 [Mycena rosella]
MTAESATDSAPISAADTVSHLADAVSHLHIDMQTSDPSKLVRERILDETVEDGGDNDVGAALLDDEVDGGDEDDESNLDTEQQNAETAADSVNNQWLATTLEKVQKKIQMHGQPRVYREGQLWIHPKDPIFALQEAATTSVYSPDDRFPVAISHRSALDISQMDMMKITFAGRFGADPFSKMVRELKYLRHSHLEAMYLHAALHYGLRGTSKIPPFSSFKNRIGFAGYAPSTKYLKSMFISWFASHRLHIDRIMSSLSGRILKADHTFKTVDHQGRLPGGEPIHTALYNAVNDSEEPFKGCMSVLKLSLPDMCMAQQKQFIRTTLVVIALMAQIPLALKSVLTHPRIVKFGHEITATAKHLSSAWGLSIPPSSLVDLGKLAKLKGAAADASCSLSTLCGAVLNLQLRDTGGKSQRMRKRHASSACRPHLVVSSDHADDMRLTHVVSACTGFCPQCEPNVSTSSLPLTSQVDDLAHEVDCTWSVQQALMKLGAVGIPLQPSQLRPAQLVALVIGNKPQAWGELAEHDGYLVVPKTQGKVSVTQAYSVIKLTRIFVPGFIIAKHGQTLEWLNENGKHAVVQTRTLRSRAPEPPHPATESAHDPDLGTPAVVSIPSVAEQLAQGPPTHLDKVAREISSDLQLEVESGSRSDEDSHDDIMSDSPEPTADDLEELLLDSVNHAQNILHQPQTAETLASRVLDDAYHFMDRCLRLLSKKHPAYKKFAHLFSESIFIRDGEDEAKVREVLKQKGISWEYAIRAKKAALHRRIRRYIPSPEKLVQDLLILLEGSTEKAVALIETARLGFLPDPPGLAVYYWIGCDKDGLKLYRTIGHYNRTGLKWNNHFDIWLLDEIVETAIQLDVKPTFPEPKLLATRIATSETFGIIPTTPQLASANEIIILPSPNILAAPHYDDNHQFALTQFTTKPVNLYRYLQLRQRTTTPVVPAHTQREFELFQANIVSFIPLNTSATPEKVYKLVRDPSRKAVVLPAITHEPVEVDYTADPLLGVDLSSFNPMAMRQQLDARRAVQAAIAAVPNLEPPPVQLEAHPVPRTEPHQTVFVFTSAEQDGDYELLEIARPTKKVRPAVEQGNPTAKRQGPRCAPSARMPIVATS